jgi:hypothetical protein
LTKRLPLWRKAVIVDQNTTVDNRVALIQARIPLGLQATHA